MKLTKVDPSIVFRKTKLQSVLEEFIETGYEVAEVDSSEYGKAYSLSGGLRSAIKRFHHDSIEVKTVDGKVYLINTAKQ